MSNQDLPTTASGQDLSHEHVTVSAPTTPHNFDIVHEIRSATAQLSARMDGFNLRLGDMERHHRVQSSHPPSPSPGARTIPPATGAATTAAFTFAASETGQPEEILPASVTIHRGPHNARSGSTIPPHMSRAAAALASSSIPPPSRPGASFTPSTTSNPLDKYKSMTKGEKSNVRRALAGLGLSIPVLMSMFSGDDDETGSTSGTADDLGTPMSASTPTPAQSHQPEATFVTRSIQTEATPSPIHIAPVPVASEDNSTPSPATLASADIPVTHTTNSTAPASAHTPVVATPAPSIEPAPNISAVPTSGVAAMSARQMTCKTEWIGEFNGDPLLLENFLMRIRDLLRSETQPELIPLWNKAVFRTIPRTFTKDAAVWHQGLSNPEAAELTSYEAWCIAMRAAFPVNMTQLRKDARNRKWRTTEETSVGYYFHKVCLLRQAYGEDQPEESLVTDIKEGLPESMIALLRLPRKGATLADLRLELGDWEPNWRVQYKVTLRSAPIATADTPTLPPTYTPAVSRILQTTMGRSASAPATPAATGTKFPSATTLPAAPSGQHTSKPMSKFAAAYDPSRIIPAKNG